MLYLIDSVSNRAYGSIQGFSILLGAGFSLFYISASVLIIKTTIPKTYDGKFSILTDLWIFGLPSIVILISIIPNVRPLQINKPLSSISLSVSGAQWYWIYKIFEDTYESYLLPISLTDGAFPLITDFFISLPVQVPFAIYITSNDVIHSWTIPRLGIKVDAIPGHITTANCTSWIPGNFYGQCSELCGSFHSFMPININIL